MKKNNIKNNGLKSLFNSLSSTSLDELLILEPEQKPATIIFPHGLGTDATSRQEIVIENELHKKFPNVKFIFPQAPVRKVNINAGYVAPDFGKGQEMNSWFDIQWKWEEIKEPLELNDFEKVAKFNDEELKQSIRQINKIIRQEIKKGVSADRIILMGFSQGGALTASMILASKYKLGGFIVLAGWLPNQKQLFKKAEKNNHLNQETPTLFCHGSQDEWVPYWLGKKHYELFKKWEYSVEFITYDSLNHQISTEQIKKVKQFLENILNPQTQLETKIVLPIDQIS